jgi:hypothetical protein
LLRAGPASLPPAPHPAYARSKQMMDLVMVALGLAFFALSVGYAIACDRM